MLNMNISDSKDKRILYLLFILAFALYASSITFKYALDDSYVILENKYTQQGFSGIPKILTTHFFAGVYGDDSHFIAGGRYRPLSLVTFAIEYQFFGQNPMVSHFLNVFLYALLIVVLFKVLLVFFNKFPQQKWYVSLPFLATLLFMVHPIHTEAIANIKGRDEILALLFILLTLLYIFKFIQSNIKSNHWIAALFFFLSLLSKEVSITFIVIIPMCLYFFTSKTIKEIIKISLPIFITGIIFLIIRQAIIGFKEISNANDLMNNPFLGVSFADKYATIFYTLGLYLKLLFFPHPLTFDYYPRHIPILTWSDPWVLLSLLAYIIIGIIALIGFKRKSIVSFCILFYLITLAPTSNLFFPIGAFMGERFIFVSSIGFCLFIVFLLIHYVKKQIAIILISGFILTAFTIKTISRIPAWYDSWSLFFTDIKTCPNSIKSNSACGQMLYNKAVEEKDTIKKKEYFNESLIYLRKAERLYPDYINVLNLLSNAIFQYKHDVDSTLFYYKKMIDISPYFGDVYLNLPVVLGFVKDIDKKLEVLEYIYTRNQNNYWVCYEMGEIYGRDKKDFNKSIIYLERACLLKSNSFEPFNKLGLAYAFSGNLQKALELFLKAYNIKPDEKQVLVNIGLTYQNLGQPTMAANYFAMANNLK